MQDSDTEQFFSSFKRDVAKFKAELPTLLNECPGEYVAILDGEIVAHLPSWENLAELTNRQYPDRFVLLEQVTPDKREPVDMDTMES